jgi:hypothetical protein
MGPYGGARLYRRGGASRERLEHVYLARHARPCAGHPRLSLPLATQDVMALELGLA